jgi:hypothetical protein
MKHAMFVKKYGLKNKNDWKKFIQDIEYVLKK